MIEYEQLKSCLTSYLSIDDKILHIGCGNSELGEQLYNEGFKNITNIDFSVTVIDKMKERCKHLTSMTWYAMDLQFLEFDNNR